MSETTAGYTTQNVDSIGADRILNDFASYGLEILKHSVLLVLYEAKHKDELLQAQEIRRRLGIPQAKDERMGHTSLVFGVLSYLKDEEKVAQFWSGSYTWQITEKGLSVIEG